MRRAERRADRAAPRTVASRRVTAVLVAVALALAACSGADDTAPPQDPEPPAESAPPEVADDTGAAADDRDAATDGDEPDGAADPDDPAARPSRVAPDPPPPPEGRQALAARIQALVDAAGVSAPDIELGVLVTDAYGREIAAHQADRPLLPASTQKVVTAAAILTTLGPSGRFTTRVDATAPIAADGALHGDLVLVGGGDPALATDEYARWVYPARPTTPLADLADTLVAQGLRRLEGDVVGVAPGFTGAARAAGWPDRYFGSFDARYAAGLTVDGGLRTIVTYPEAEGDGTAGTDGTADTEASADRDGQGSAGDEPGDGLDPEDLGPPEVTVDHVTDPAAHAATELRRLLEERDVEVVGESRSGDVEAPVIGRLAVVDSPPMDELLRFTVERSDNHLADGMFRAIGRIRTGEGSWARGDRALRQVLDRFDIEHGEAVFADGSGLSREDRLTARLLVDLDRHMTDGPVAETWVSLMAVMGESGTLRERLRGTVAAGRFHGKTGTLRDVTALSGAVVGEDGTRYHLAVLANEASGPGRWVARELMDELVLQLSADVAGCEVAIARADPDAGSDEGSDAASEDPDPPPLPRSVISC